MLTTLQLQILERRGITLTEAEKFVRADIEDLHDPRLLKDAERAVDAIERALEQEIPITVYADYDCDGVTSAALLMEGLQNLGAQVDWYINSRFEEGYGALPSGIEEIARRGTPRLIVTADNGIQAYDALERAAELSLDVVVTDHHEPGEKRPKALAVVNPKQADCSYPYKHLAGVGVAFKVLQLLYRRRGLERKLLRLLDLVAIGTVADVMPLTGENRIIVKNGLKLINWEPHKVRVGLQAIKESAGLKGDVNAHHHLGFIFGPLLNAQGRVEGIPGTAIELLLTRDRSSAASLVQILDQINRERQDLTRRQTEAARQLVMPNRQFLVLYDSGFHEGIIGLIASRLKEEHYKPVLVLTDDERMPGVVKGSARSVPGFSLKQHLIEANQDLLIKGGGHDLAAGISLRREDVEILSDRLHEAASLCPDDIFRHRLEADVRIQSDEVNENLIRQLEELAPFGNGFPRPLLEIADFAVESVQYMGSEGQHVRLKGPSFTALAFSGAEAYRSLGEPNRLSLIGRPEWNEWNGKSSVQFQVKEGGLIPLIISDKVG